MLRKKTFKILSLSLCLTISSIGMVFADTRLAAPDAPVSNEVINVEIDQKVYDKQVEIDKVLFVEENLKLFEEKGIFITHTGPMDGYVEVGITPLTEENKEFILKMLGDDKIQVVEGIQAVTLEYSEVATSDMVASTGIVIVLGFLGGVFFKKILA